MATSSTSLLSHGISSLSSMSLRLRLPPAAAFWHSQWRRLCNKSRHICMSAPSSPTMCSATTSLPVLVDDGFVGYISGQNKATDVGSLVRPLCLCCSYAFPQIVTSFSLFPLLP